MGIIPIILILTHRPGVSSANPPGSLWHCRKDPAGQVITLIITRREAAEKNCFHHGMGKSLCSASGRDFAQPDDYTGIPEIRSSIPPFWSDTIRGLFLGTPPGFSGGTRGIPC